MNQPQPDPEPIPARFAGKALSLDGFTSDVTRPVIVQPVCFGPWCGGMASDKTVMAFAQVTEAGYVIASDPCGTWVFPAPTPEVLDAVTACLRGEACEAVNPFPE